MIFDMITIIYHLYDMEESASHPSPGHPENPYETAWADSKTRLHIELIDFLFRSS